MSLDSRPKQQRCFVLEGNIGAGKSTFLRILSEYLSIHPIFEPHTKWQDVDGAGNLLDAFYQDTSRWAYTFQSYAFVTRVKEQEIYAKKYPFSELVLERSVYSDRYCFAKNLAEMNNMSALEWKLYQEWFSWLVDNYTQKPAGFIYLQTDPKICYQRLLKRNRYEESAVSLSYLEKLHQKHEDWLIHKKGVEASVQDIPVLVLECNKDFENDKDEQVRHMSTIAAFFNLGNFVVPGSNGSSTLFL